MAFQFSGRPGRLQAGAGLAGAWWSVWGSQILASHRKPIGPRPFTSALPDAIVSREEQRDGDERLTPTDREAAAPELAVTAAVCGLFCEACSIFLASREDPKRLALLAERHGQTEEETYCEGCRSQRRSKYCRSCTLSSCAAERGYAFCGECDKFPCRELESFRVERPHRTEIYRNLVRIDTIGVQAWLVEAAERHTCPSCGTINSAYDLSCRACGHDPSCAFVAAHGEAIVRRLAGL